MSRLLAALVGAVCVRSGAAALSDGALNSNNWDDKTLGKTLFVWFHTTTHDTKHGVPDEHDMIGDWTKLTDAFQDHPVALVANVDCSAAGRLICKKLGVDSTPAIMEGDADALMLYEGRGGTYDELYDYTTETIAKPRCGPASPGTCEEEQREILEKFMGMEKESLAASIKFKEKQMRKAKRKWEKSVKAMKDDIADATKKWQAHNDKTLETIKTMQLIKQMRAEAL